MGLLSNANRKEYFCPLKVSKKKFEAGQLLPSVLRAFEVAVDMAGQR